MCATKEFVKKSKVTVGYDYRRGFKRINTVTMHFNEERVGKTVYMKKAENGIEIKTEKPRENGYVAQEVKLAKNKSLKKPQQYLNMRGFVDEAKAFCLYRTEDGYVLEEALSQSPSKRKLKENELRIYDSNMVRIPITVWRKMLDGREPKDCEIRVIEHYKPYLYMEIDVVAKGKNTNVHMEDILGGTLRQTHDLQEFTHYYSAKSNVVIVNRFFRKAADVGPGDTLFWRFSKDGKLILENKNQICDICGCFVERSKRTYETMEICSECYDATKILKSSLVKNGNNMTAVRKELLTLSAQVTELYKQITEGK